MRKLLFMITIVYTILLITRPQEFIPGLAEVPLLQPILLAAFGIWLAMPDKGLELPQYRTLPILLLFVWLSLGFAGWWGGIVPAAERLVPPMLLFVIVSGCVRSAQEFRIFSAVMIGCAAVLVLHGHWQVTNGISWTGQPMIEGRITYAGIFNDPNDMGLLFVMSIAMSIFHLHTQRRTSVRLLIVALLGWLFYGVYLTDSRGTMLATMLIIALALWRSYGKALVIVFGAILIPVLLAFTRLSELDTEEASAANRFDAWYEGLELLIANPLFGIGWGMFSDYNFGLTAHNTFVLAMSELGLLGYTVWLSFVAMSGWMIFRLVFPAPQRVKARPGRLLSPVGATPLPRVADLPAVAGHAPRVALPQEQREVALRTAGAVTAVAQTKSPAPDPELERLASMFLLFAVCGFTLGAFFLSQSYKAMIFLNCALVVGRYLGMREAGMPVPTHLLGMKLPLMFCLAILSVIALWLLLKILL
jgi:putative inorganic carbon (HCO3(-)) transporter